MVDDTKQSKGGKARAEKLSSEERKRIAVEGGRARAAAVATLPKVEHSGTLELGGASIPCAVLSDERRVLSENGITNAILGVRSGASKRLKKASQENGALLPLFIAPGQLKPFIDQVFSDGPLQQIVYQNGRRIVTGYDARILRAVCEVWLRAREAGVLQGQQLDKAQRAENLIRALADVALIALVDEATGYQEKRAKDELQKILAAYISPTLLPWSERFPIDFFREMFRVWRWPWPAEYEVNYKGPKGPRYAGKLIKQLVLENLPNGVLEELESKNPPNEKWQRKNRMGQLLTSEVGHPHVDKLVANVTMLFRMADDKQQFWKLYARAFNKTPAQLDMFEDEDPDT